VSTIGVCCRLRDQDNSVLAYQFHPRGIFHRLGRLLFDVGYIVLVVHGVFCLVSTCCSRNRYGLATSADLTSCERDVEDIFWEF